MPATLPRTVSPATPHTVQDYGRHGWTVTEAFDGLRLITDERIAAVELTGPLAAGVRRYLRANNLSGPVIEIRGAQRREIHLVVGAGKAARAIEMLREAGAIVHTGGASFPLPLAGGSVDWGIAPDEARWVPPLVAISAAVRAVSARALSRSGRLAC